jgi:proline racemase
MRSSRFIQAIDLHAGGAPGRVLLNCSLPVHGASMAERLEYCRTYLDPLRRYLLQEPRGYPGLSCNLLMDPVSEGADAGYICLEQGGFTPMSGSNTICVVTALLETGMIAAREGGNRVVLDTPAGVIPTTATVKNGRVVEVEFENVPAFVAQRNVAVNVQGIGKIEVDIAYGGQFYVLASVDDFGASLEVADSRELARIGAAILAAARSLIPVRHPTIPEIHEITWALLYQGSPVGGVARSCVVGPTGQQMGDPTSAVGVIDRSPCGTGTSARMAQLHARGELVDGYVLRHENLLGEYFSGRMLGTAMIGGQLGIRTTIAGRAFVTGLSQLLLDTEDPFPTGFTLGDIW